MTILAYSLSAVLAVISAMHLYWAFGGIWPARSEQTLARTVVGMRNITRMPSRGMTVAVVVCLAVAAVWPLSVAGVVGPDMPVWFAGAGTIILAAVFLLRGTAGMVSLMDRRFPEEPFITLNRQIYSPLCFAIGAGFLGLGLNI